MGGKVSSFLPGRTTKACINRACQLGLKIKQVSWTKAEDDILQAKYSLMGAKTSEFLPGRTAKASMHRARQLGLSYNPNKEQ